jgi:hypothetical protein
MLLNMGFESQQRGVEGASVSASPSGLNVLLLKIMAWR